MPLIESKYQGYPLLFSKHLETIYPAIIRKVRKPDFKRERISTPDDDFLDLDWHQSGNKVLAILSHGLEGNTETNYIRGMTNHLATNQLDVLAWNYRGCSGEINKQLRFYHSGESNDLAYVINYAINKHDYEKIILIGFSIGGNITLKYLGERADQIHPKIKSAVTFSVPCHLSSGAKHLAKPGNIIYMQRFLNSLTGKIKAKEKLFPQALSSKGIYKIRTFYEFDQRYTAPLHGFQDAEDYWHRNSSIYFLDKIRTPTLLVTAKNDPFLSPQCFPYKEAQESEFLFLETPKKGGHCGFYQKNKEGIYWSEERTIEFIDKYL